MATYRTGLYGRTSQDDPRRVTIEIQQKALRDWASRDDSVVLIDEFWDDGVSGKIPLWDRPEGRRLLELVEAGKIDTVAVVFADRFGRTLLDGLQAVKRLEEHGVKLVAIQDGWDARRQDSPLYFQFRVMMAEEEHRRICARMTAGKRRAMERDNAPPGGPLTFGYRMGSRGEYVIDEQEAAVVRGLFDRLLDGWSQPRLLEWARQSGTKPGRKFQKRASSAEPTICRHHAEAQWHLPKIGKILRCRTYLGVRTWAGREFPCPQIIDQSTFDRAQEVLCASKEKYRWTKGNVENGYLSGLLRCGTCGRPFYTWLHVDKVRRYACSGMRLTGCKAKMIRVKDTDEAVWKLIEECLADPAELVKKIREQDSRTSNLVGEAREKEASLVSQMSEIEKEVQEVWREQAANGWPMSWITPRLNKLNALRDKLSSEITSLRKTAAKAEISMEDMQVIATMLESLREKMKHPTPEMQREVAKTLIISGVVYTRGEGRKKTAEVRIEMGWRELLYPKLPKQCSNGSEGNTIITSTASIFYPPENPC